ncbi:MAG: hypothetical protein OQK82_05950 [Candidatus Pacearchaeota archaeon]|nr:hypothetical protein [Candidatus Pacearchaeota archaeon]
MKSFIEYENILKEICKKENIQFIPLFDLLKKEDLSDGMHPNTEGHKKIYEKVKQELNKILDNKNGNI